MNKLKLLSLLLLCLIITSCGYERVDAEKLIVAAQAEKETNELRNQALTPAVLEKMWIEKWDGKLPMYGQVPTLFKDISK